jgi:aspartyl-tRNA(Asn)/glutamyl-tRNA(Gln) amidotransferase subunit C
MKLTDEQVKHIAWLARLAMSQAEIERFKVQLSHILENFDILQQVDTTDVLPATQLSASRNVFREDKAAESYPQQQVLANAPNREENCFKVRAILE